jgi:hypothetical protein
MSACARTTLAHELLKQINEFTVCLSQFPPRRQFQRTWGPNDPVSKLQFPSEQRGLGSVVEG